MLRATVIWTATWGCCAGRRLGASSVLLRPAHALGQQHVIQLLELSVGGTLCQNATNVQPWVREETLNQCLLSE